MRINLSVSSDEEKSLRAIAEWQKFCLPGLEPKITAVATACMRIGIKSSLMQLEAQKPKNKEKKI